MSEIKPKHIFLWAHPRSLSTAMEVYFRARGDFQVVHEPFADSYWQGGDADARLDALLETLESADGSLFVKDIAHHLPRSIATNQRLTQCFTHVVLVRSPLAAFHSHLKVNPEVKDHEFGFESLYQNFLSLKQITGKSPLVLLADELLQDPEKTIGEFCEIAEIQHLPEALSWEPKQHTDWKAAQKWQVKAAGSSGFEKASVEPLAELPERLNAVFERHQHCYFKLLAVAKQQKLIGDQL